MKKEFLEFTDDNNRNYEDIIDLPHHVSNKRPRMSIIDRAAQFSPFAALVGYDAAVKETARLTADWTELDENSKTILNEKLQMVLEQAQKSPEIIITYFVKDEKKNGGAYVTAAGILKKVDTYEQMLVMRDGTRIPLSDIFEIEGELFRSMDF